MTAGAGRDRLTQASVDLLWQGQQAGRAARRRVTGGRVVSALVIGTTVALVAVIGAAGPSHGAVAVTAPVRVVVDSPTEPFTAVVATTAGAGRVHAASVWVGYPGDAALTLAGSATSVTSAVPVRGQLDTRRITSWGAMTAVAVDDADGRSRAVGLNVRRRSVARLTHAEVDGGRVRLGARVTHYDPVAGRYVSSKLSPVRFQEQAGAGWVTVATGQTTGDGLTGAVLAAAPGVHRFRVARPDGATVWGSVSATVRVVVPASSGSSQSGGFAWNFTGACCVTSRTWSMSVTSDITIAAVVEPCKAKGGRTQFVIGLYRGKTFVGQKVITCSGSARWKKQPAGSYRFVLTLLPPWRDSQTFVGYGTVDWVQS